MAIIEKTGVNSGYNDNKVIDGLMTYTEWLTLTTLPCKAGSTVKIIDYLYAGTHVDVVKLTDDNHSTLTGFMVTGTTNFKLIEQEEFVGAGNGLFTAAANTFVLASSGFSSGTINNGKLFYPSTYRYNTSSAIFRRALGNNAAQQNAAMWRAMAQQQSTSKLELITLGIAIVGVSGNSSNFQRLKVGYGDVNFGTTTAIASGAYFEAPLIADPQFWWAVCILSGVQTRVQTTIPFTPFVPTADVNYVQFALLINYKTATPSITFGYKTPAGIFVGVTTITTNLFGAKNRIGIEAYTPVSGEGTSFFIDYYSLENFIL